MTEILRVAHSPEAILVGTVPAHPEQTALVEARGATLCWTAPADSALPSALIHDANRATDWLWEIYGTEAAAAILAHGPGEDEAELSPTGAGAESRVLEAARALAHLTWAECWWPASTLADVAPLELPLLRAEKAIAAGAIEHLLDDDEAVERALAAAVDAVHRLAQLSADPDLGTRAQDVADRLRELAEDYGTELPEPAPVVPPDRTMFALAAGDGGTADGIVVSRGSSSVDWTLVPQGTVDAAAEASWAVVRRDGASVVEATVPRAPEPAGAAPTRSPLAARFGPVEFPLEPADSGEVTGRAPLPAAVLLLPAAERTLTVYAPDFAPADAVAQTGPEVTARRAAIVTGARARLTAPTATLAERVAGRRR